MLTTEGNAMRFWIELFRLVIGRRVGEAVVMFPRLEPHQVPQILSGGWCIRVRLGEFRGGERGGYKRGKFIIEAPEFIELQREENLGD